MKQRWNLKIHIINVHRISKEDAESYIGKILDKSTDVESSLENSNYVQATIEDIDTTADTSNEPEDVATPPIGEIFIDFS